MEGMRQAARQVDFYNLDDLSTVERRFEKPSKESTWLDKNKKTKIEIFFYDIRLFKMNFETSIPTCLGMNRSKNMMHFAGSFQGRITGLFSMNSS